MVKVPMRFSGAAFTIRPPIRGIFKMVCLLYLLNEVGDWIHFPGKAFAAKIYLRKCLCSTLSRRSLVFGNLREASGPVVGRAFPGGPGSFDPEGCGAVLRFWSYP